MSASIGARATAASVRRGAVFAIDGDGAVLGCELVQMVIGIS
ncbi:hypothetical protein [Pengzhenrongella phosphoraccumulans]